MLHTGEGDCSTGEVIRRPGRYRSECCQVQHQADAGESVPACSRCGHAADWTWVGPFEDNPKSEIRHPTYP